MLVWHHWWSTLTIHVQFRWQKEQQIQRFLLGNQREPEFPHCLIKLPLTLVSKSWQSPPWDSTNLMKHLYSHSSLFVHPKEYSTHYKMLVLGVQKIDMGIFVSIVGYLVTQNGRTENLVLHHNKLFHWPWFKNCRAFQPFVPLSRLPILLINSL